MCRQETTEPAATDCSMEYRLSRSPSSARALDFVELLLDGLAKLEIIDVAENEDGFQDSPEGFESSVESVLFGIGVEPSEEIRSGGFLQLDGNNESENVVSVLLNEFSSDVARGFDCPSRSVNVLVGVEEVELLPFEVLDSWSVGKTELMHDAEDGFGIAVSIG
jgi:hypothetical protein